MSPFANGEEVTAYGNGKTPTSMVGVLSLVPSARFERAAFSSAGRRSNPLSYEGS